jgi:probable HAF family extracellular repeat protein
VRGINSSGQIIGSGFVTENGVLRGVGIDARDQNDAGQVVGDGRLYQNGALSDLGTLGGDDSLASAINNLGQVVGRSSTTGNTGIRPFFYSGGVMSELPMPNGATNGYAVDLNDAGQVIGGYQTGSNYGAFFYDQTGTREMGDLGGGRVYAYSINSSGQAVGTAYVPSVGGEHAFYFDPSDDALTNLNAHIDPTSALALYVTLTAVTEITDTGFVLAYGWDSRTGGKRSYILQQISLADPVPLPTAAWHTYSLVPLPQSGWMLLIGIAGLGVFFGNRRNPIMTT